MNQYRGWASLLVGMAFSGSLLAADVPSYDLGHEGLVLDSRQQLAWMRCSLGQRFQQDHCLGEAERFSWSEAQARIRELASPECPWRLPRFHELRGLMQHAPDRDMAIDLEAFPDTPAGWYWNEASAGGHSQQDCFVDFGGEGRTRCNMGGQFHLRPVMTGGKAASCLRSQ
jgi:hypothetical protein